MEIPWLRLLLAKVLLCEVGGEHAEAAPLLHHRLLKLQRLLQNNPPSNYFSVSFLRVPVNRCRMPANDSACCCSKAALAKARHRKYMICVNLPLLSRCTMLDRLLRLQQDGGGLFEIMIMEWTSSRGKITSFIATLRLRNPPPRASKRVGL